MELRHLRYFIKAAEMLHFTKAAEALYISQPTLSAHIQQLEEEMGTELFARVGRTVRLTESGQLLLVRAREAMHELQLASEEIGALTDLLRGTLNISALPLFGTTYLPHWIHEFNKQYPQVHVKARTGASEQVEESIASSAVDIGFTMLPIENAEFGVKELFSDEVVLAVAKTHPLANKSKLVPEDLHQLELAMSSSRISTARLARKYFDEQGFHPTVAVEFDDGNALLAIARMGKLGAIIPSGKFQRSPDLVCLPLPEPGLRYTLAATWYRLSPAAKAFLNVVESHVATLVQQQPVI